MSLAQYDKAVLNKIKSWFKNTIYANTAITYNTIYDLMDVGDKPKLQFPLINIYRVPGFTFSDNQNFAARKQGLGLGEDSSGLLLSGRYLALDLTYQLDFYSKSSENLYDLIVQVAHALNQFPVLEVWHTDNKTGETFVERYDLVNSSSPVEQSEFDNNDRIYRAYMQYSIANARVYDITDYAKISDVELGLGVHETNDTVSESIEIDVTGEKG